MTRLQLKAFFFIGALALLYIVATVAIVLSATPTQTVTISGTFTDNADNEQGFRVYRCAGAGCVPAAVVGTLPVNSSGFVDTIIGDQGGQTYVYAVSAFNEAGESAKLLGTVITPQIIVIPGIPTGIVLTVTGVTIQ